MTIITIKKKFQACDLLKKQKTKKQTLGLKRQNWRSVAPVITIQSVSVKDK